MTAKLNDVDPQAWLADRESRRIPLKDINVRALAQHTSTPPITRGKIQFRIGISHAA